MFWAQKCQLNFKSQGGSARADPTPAQDLGVGSLQNLIGRVEGAILFHAYANRQPTDAASHDHILPTLSRRPPTLYYHSLLVDMLALIQSA
jgi:hypothetical protein